MNLPPFVYSLRFWEAVSLVLAVVAVQLGWMETADAVVILGVILAGLRLIGVIPELRAKGRIR